MKEYAHALDAADEAVVFYSPEALAIKNRTPISPDEIKQYFKREDLKIATNLEEIQQIMNEFPRENAVILMMSSGNFGGLDLNQL